MARKSESRVNVKGNRTEEWSPAHPHRQSWRNAAQDWTLNGNGHRLWQPLSTLWGYFTKCWPLEACHVSTHLVWGQHPHQKELQWPHPLQEGQGRETRLQKRFSYSATFSVSATCWTTGYWSILFQNAVNCGENRPSSRWDWKWVSFASCPIDCNTHSCCEHQTPLPSAPQLTWIDRKRSYISSNILSNIAPHMGWDSEIDFSSFRFHRFDSVPQNQERNFLEHTGQCISKRSGSCGPSSLY